MNLLEKTITELYEHKEYHQLKGRNTLNYKKDIITLACMKISKYYMILPPTERNIEIVKSILTLYPDIKKYTKYNDIEKRVTINLFYFLKDRIDSGETNVQDTIDKLLKNCIVLRKNNDLNEFVEASKIGNLLISGKRYIIKQIGFLNQAWPVFSYHEGVANKINKEIKGVNTNKIKNELTYINANSKHIVNFSMKATVKFEKELDISILKKRMSALEFKKSIQNEIKSSLNFKLPINYEQIKFGYMTLTLPTSKLDELYNKNCRFKHDLHKIGLGFSNAYNGKTSFTTSYDVYGIDMEDFYEYTNELLKTNKISN